MVHNIVGWHFLGQAGIFNRTNPLSDPRGIFRYSRVFDPRPPFSRGANRPTYLRVIRTATGNPQHPGARAINRQIPDLADFDIYELYEIKPNKSSQIISAQNKLTQAQHELHSSNVGLTNWGRGTSYTPLPIVPIPGSTNFAVVRNHSPGIIVYDLINTRLAFTVIRASATLVAHAIEELMVKVSAALARNSRSPAAALLT